MGQFDPNNPSKAYEINGWMISKNGDMWQAVNKKTGQIGRGDKLRGNVEAFAKKTTADKK